MRVKLITLLAVMGIFLCLAGCGGQAAPVTVVVTVEPGSAEAATAEPSAPPDMGATATAVAARISGIYPREQLIEDARQLADIIESIHPDPYINGGGRIAFHRRLQHVLTSIPEEGMTDEEFLRLLRPFVAAVGDSHTRIWDGYAVDAARPGGAPLQFAVVEESLYVAGVPESLPQELIGHLLVSVEGLPVEELVARQRGLVGCENDIYALRFLAIESLWSAPYMQELIPEWEDTSRVSVTLQSPDGEIEEFTFDLPIRMLPMTTPESRVTLPTFPNRSFGYAFLDDSQEIMYLRVREMTSYREAYEMRYAAGSGDTTEEERARLISATEAFRALVVEMEEAGTETLIVDLRDNDGGNSLMSDILIYFLYGQDALVEAATSRSAAGGGQGVRYSEMYLESQESLRLEDISEDVGFPLIVGDYDFRYDFADDPDRFQETIGADGVAAELLDWYQMTPTFYTEFQSGDYSGYYLPEHVLVLMNDGTFSSGFTMARTLSLAGATLVGSASAQGVNSFGDVIIWHLDNTGMEGYVSGGWFVEVPDDPARARVWPVDYPLAYERLASYGFDPNADYLYALDLIEEMGQ